MSVVYQRNRFEELSSRLRTTKYTPLHLSIFVSVVIHALMLWQFRFSLIDPIKSLSPFVITLADAPSSELETSSTPDSSARGRPTPSILSRKIIAPPGGNTAKPAAENASNNPWESSDGAAAGSTGLRNGRHQSRRHWHRWIAAWIGGERTRWANLIGHWIRHWKSLGYRRRDRRWGDDIQRRRNVGSRGVGDRHSTVYSANNITLRKRDLRRSRPLRPL